MTDDRTLPPEREKRIEDELRSLSFPAPDPGFQASLRRRFATGELESTQASPEADPSHSGAFTDPTPGGTAGTPEVLEFEPPRARKARPAWRVWLVPAFAAAALLLVYFIRPTPPDRTHLEVLASGEGSLRIGDRDFPLDRADQFQPLLEPGTLIAVSGDMSAEFHLQVEDDFTLVAIAGAEFTVPLPAQRGRRSFRVDMGEVRIATLPGLLGEAIEIGAPGTRVDVMGTTLAVIADTASTCVCLLDGNAMMMMKDGGMTKLDPGMRRIMHMDPAVPDEIVPIFGNERMKLEMLRTAVGPSK